MPSTINPFRKLKVKQSLSKGNSARQALRDAGYPEASVSHSTGMAVVKCSMKELISEAEKKGIISKAWHKAEVLIDDPKASPSLVQALCTKDMTEKIDQSVRNLADTTLPDEELEKEIEAIRQRRLKGNLSTAGSTTNIS